MELSVSEKNYEKTALLFLAITIHNIPEGLAVGVTFGALATNNSSAAFIGALGLALGIGTTKYSGGSSFGYSDCVQTVHRVGRPFIGVQCSAIVEPIAAVLGAFGVTFMTPIFTLRPFLCRAGAMIFVVVEELIPESQTNGNTDIATLGLMAGFIIMMILDVALG